jgi:hypothetical protein
MNDTSRPGYQWSNQQCMKCRRTFTRVCQPNKLFYLNQDRDQTEITHNLFCLTCHWAITQNSCFSQVWSTFELAYEELVRRELR